jgi:hypothetical protein
MTFIAAQSHRCGPAFSVLLTVASVASTLTSACAAADLPEHDTTITRAANGAIFVGSRNDKRAYLSLDRVLVPEDVRGAWSDAQRGCDKGSSPTPTDDHVGGGQMVVTQTHVVTMRGRMVITRSYVRAEGRVSSNRRTKKKATVLSERKHGRADPILLEVGIAGEGAAALFLELQRTDEPMTIQVSENGGATTRMVRCFLNVAPDQQ